MKPMLAGKADEDVLASMLKDGPLLLSPKLDGVRGLVVDGQLLSRSLKPIRNVWTQKQFGIEYLNGFDGELIVGSPTSPDVYRTTNSGVMRIVGEPDVKFHVFDSFADPDAPYTRRYEYLRGSQDGSVTIVPSKTVTDMEELVNYEQESLVAGYEGVMVRRGDAPYKFGRSTASQGFLLKLKRFTDSEAEVLEVIELLHNENEAQTNELGRTFRSSAASGKVGADTMGACWVRDIHTGVEFSIGTGFSAEERSAIWQDTKVIGKIAKYKSFAIGVKEKPRHPVFLGWRDPDDGLYGGETCTI